MVLKCSPENLGYWYVVQEQRQTATRAKFASKFPITNLRTFPKKVKSQPRITIRIKTGRSPFITDALYYYSDSKLSWFWSRFLNGFQHLWAWQPSLSMELDFLNKFFCLC